MKGEHNERKERTEIMGSKDPTKKAETSRQRTRFIRRLYEREKKMNITMENQLAGDINELFEEQETTNNTLRKFNKIIADLVYRVDGLEKALDKEIDLHSLPPTRAEELLTALCAHYNEHVSGTPLKYVLHQLGFTEMEAEKYAGVSLLWL